MPADASGPAAGLVEELRAAVAEAVAEALARPLPQLFDQVTAMAYVGLKRSGWFRAKSAGDLPRAVYVEGSGERWRRRDLDAWIERMKPRRKKG